MAHRLTIDFFTGFIVLLGIHFCGCSALKPSAAKTAGIEAQMTLTPPEHYTAYYSTQKARALGESYSDNLDHLLEQLTKSHIGQMHFANAIVSLSLGFFTHSASRPQDERYLEAIIALPDILAEEEDINVTVSRLFAQYGREILTILSSDTAIVDDPHVAGYGLNFSWRNMAKTPSGPRMTMREAVLYSPKKKAERFLNYQIEQDELLGTSTIFVRQGDHAAQQMQYAPLPAWVPPAPALLSQQSQNAQGTVPSTLQETATLQGAVAQEQPPTSPQPTVPPPSPTFSSLQKRATEEPLFDSPDNTQLSLATPPPSPLSSESTYLVQLSFFDLLEAQRWAETLKARRYTTSFNFAKKGQHPILLQVGNFSSIAEAHQFLDNCKTQGFEGLILENPR